MGPDIWLGCVNLRWVNKGTSLLSCVCSAWHKIDVEVPINICFVKLLLHFFKPHWSWHGVDVVKVSMPFLVLAPSVFLVLLKFCFHIGLIK